MLEQETAQLATSIRQEVTKYRGTTSVPLRRLVRVRRRDFSLHYHEDFGFGQFAPERIEEDIWEWDDQSRFLDSVVKGLEYKSLLSALGSKASSLESFARALCVASFKGLTDKELKERASSFARELRGESVQVIVTAFIDGLSISDSPLVISDGFILRQPTPEDLAEYVVLDEYGGFSFPSVATWFHVTGEFVFQAVNPGLAQREFLRTIEALCMFRVGGIAANRYAMRSMHSFLGGGAMISSTPGQSSRFTYKLSKSDAPGLGRFLDDIVPLLPDPFDLDRGTTQREIAHTRYRDALFQGGPSERTITSAITGLEALFLKAEPELTHRLGQRVSVFLRALRLKDTPLAIYNAVTKGYGIRSKFIHGGSLKPKDRPQADALAPVLLEYARICTVAFFQMTTSKDDLLAQLDRAMIDPSSVSELEVSLASVVHK